MDRRELIDQARIVMMRYAGADLRGDAWEEMNRRVGRFFAEQVSRLDKSEIMDRMTTPMKALGWFNAYQCENFMQHCCSEPAFEADGTCRLT